MTSKTPNTPVPTAAPTTSPPPLPSPSLPTNLEYISRAKHNIYSTLATRRPWRQIFDYSALSRPGSPFNVFSRLKTNLSYFRVNFALVVLLVLFLSLLGEPFSLLVFLVMLIAWLFLFFLRDEPLVLCGRAIDDRIVLAVLSFFTVFFLLFAGATSNIVISLAVGVGIVVVYSVCRKTDDLFLDGEEAAGASLLAGQTCVGPDVYQTSSSHR